METHRGSALACELGHIVVEPGGQACGCGGRGCLETVASAAALARRYRDRTRSRAAAGPPADAAEILRRAAAGPPADAAEILRRAAAGPPADAAEILRRAAAGPPADAAEPARPRQAVVIAYETGLVTPGG
jgi:predicted NBD/HSP70 family sugar kinase